MTSDQFEALIKSGAKGRELLAAYQAKVAELEAEIAHLKAAAPPSAAEVEREARARAKQRARQAKYIADKKAKLTPNDAPLTSAPKKSLTPADGPLTPTDAFPPIVEDLRSNVIHYPFLKEGEVFRKSETLFVEVGDASKPPLPKPKPKRPKKPKPALPEGELPDEECALDAYNQFAKLRGWHGADKLTDKRASTLKARIADSGGLERFYEILTRFADTDHARNWGAGKNPGNWRISLNYLITPDKWTEVMEGKFDGQKTQRR
jgi:hypothetical protein